MHSGKGKSPDDNGRELDVVIDYAAAASSTPTFRNSVDQRFSTSNTQRDSADGRTSFQQTTELYEKEGEYFRILIQVPDPSQIFVEYDMSPMYRRAIRSDIENYIADCVDDVGGVDNARIVVRMPAEFEGTPEAIGIPSAICNFFKYKQLRCKRQFRKMLARGRSNLIVSIFVLLFLLCVAVLITRASDNHWPTWWWVTDPFVQVITVSGWIAMWEPITLLLHTTREKYRDMKRYRRITRIEVVMEYESAQPTESDQQSLRSLKQPIFSFGKQVEAIQPRPTLFQNATPRLAKAFAEPEQPRSRSDSNTPAAMVFGRTRSSFALTRQSTESPAPTVRPSTEAILPVVPAFKSNKVAEIYEKDGNKYRIVIQLEEPSELFVSYDPSPTFSKALREDIEEYIMDFCEDIGGVDLARVVILLPEEYKETEEADNMSSAIVNHFRYRELQTRRELKNTLRLGRTSFMYGAGLTLVLVLISDLFMDCSAKYYPDWSWLADWTGDQVFVVAGWVSMWEPVTILLHTWRDVYITLKRFGRLTLLETAVEFEKQKVDPLPAGVHPLHLFEKK